MFVMLLKLINKPICAIIVHRVNIGKGNNSMKTTTKKITALLIAAAVFATSTFVLPATEVSAASGKSRSASLELVKDGNSFFDYRTAAGEKLYGYDTLQGACANKGFAYLTLYNRNAQKCKIVKVNLATKDVVLTSAALPLYHGNNLTFNTRKNLILVTCADGNPKRAIFVNPDTLTITSSKYIKLSKKVKKLPKKVRRKYKGFSAIAYNEKKNIYVGRLKGRNDCIIFDGNLNPKKYVKLKGVNTKLVRQGMESRGNYIYDVRSFKGKAKYNVVTVHKMNGKYVGKVVFPYGKAPGSELECIFHDGGTVYAGFYLTTNQKHDYPSYHVKRTNEFYVVRNMF